MISFHPDEPNKKMIIEIEKRQLLQRDDDKNTKKRHIYKHTDRLEGIYFESKCMHPIKKDLTTTHGKCHFTFLVFFDLYEKKERKIVHPKVDTFKVGFTPKRD